MVLRTFGYLLTVIIWFLGEHPKHPKAGGGIKLGWSLGGVAEGEKYFTQRLSKNSVSQDFNRCSVVK